MAYYLPPVDRLLTYGPCNFGEEWPDYKTEHGLGTEHVADLIQMASDPKLYRTENNVRACATIHARRALGQLGAGEAVRPLFDAMDRFGEVDDYWTEELPEVMAMIGPSAIPEVADALADEMHDESTRDIAAASLAKIGEAHPDTRDECVGLLTRQLAKHEGEAGWLNGAIAGALIDLKAVESAQVIEEAYQAGVVDETICGQLEYVDFELGLGPEPVRREIEPADFGHFGSMPVLDAGYDHSKRPDLNKIKKKRKAEKQSRKQNRKRK